MQIYLIEILLIVIFLLILIFIFFYFISEDTIKTISTMENAKFKHDGTIIESSLEFFNHIQITKDRFWQDLEIRFPKQHQHIIENINNKKNTIIHIGNMAMIMDIKSEYFKIYLLNNAMQHIEYKDTQLNNLQEVNINLSGHFVTDGKFIYRKEVEQEAQNKFIRFHKCCLLNEMQNLVLKSKHSTLLKNLPVPFLACTRSGKILMYSADFVNMFNIKSKIKDISDFLYDIRGKIIADDINFSRVTDTICNIIEQLENEYTRKFNTLDDRTIKVTYRALNNIIYIVYQDISNQFDHDYIESIFTETKEILLKKISDIILELTDNKVIFSNFEPIKIGYSKGDAINYLNTLKSEYDIINCKEKKFLISPSNQIKILNSTIEQINGQINKIENVNLLISKKNNQYLPYLHLIRFFNLQIKNLLTFLQLYNMRQNLETEIINVYDVFVNFIENTKSRLNINNLIISNNIPNNTIIKYNKEVLIFIFQKIIIAILHDKKNETLFLDIKNDYVVISINIDMDSNYFEMLNIDCNKHKNEKFQCFFPITKAQ